MTANRINESYLVEQLRGEYRLDTMSPERLLQFRAYLISVSGKGGNVHNQIDTEALITACDLSIAHANAA